MMTRSERKQTRVKISMLLREANLFEDRQSKEGRIRAAQLRAVAYSMNDKLKAGGV
jgi:hypothetical protein